MALFAILNGEFKERTLTYKSRGTPVPLLFHLIIIIMKKDFVTITPDTGGGARLLHK